MRVELDDGMNRRRERNITAVKAMFDLYREAWREHRMPRLPQGLLVWAPGAVAEIGGHRIDVQPHDVADEPYFLDIEAQFYWTAIPDWRITALEVAGEGDTVLSMARFEGTGPDGPLAPTWLSDIWRFDGEGRIISWFQIADLEAWSRWSALNTTGAYVDHIVGKFTEAGQPPRFVP